MANPDHSKDVKREKFSGTYFKRWANQMTYWLTTSELTINDQFLHLLLNHHLPNHYLLELLLQLLPPSIWNMRRLTISISIGFLVHSLIVYMTFNMSIRVLKNYGQHLRKNTMSMMLESEHLPPPSINLWCLTVKLSTINFINFKILSDTFNWKKINSSMITRYLVSLINSLLFCQLLLETSVTSKMT